MRRVGVAVAEDAELVALRKQDFVQRVRHEAGRDRLVPGGQRLRQRHDVGLQIKGLRAEHVARAAESGDHFVDDEQDLVFLQQQLDAIEVGGRRHDDAARPHHRLGEERGDGVGTLAQDQPLQTVGEPCRERFLAFACFRAAVVVRAVGVQDTRDR